MSVDQLEYVIKFADTCCVGVDRAGEYEPCGKPAVAVASGDSGEWEDEWWPVCKHHARGRSMVSLVELLAAALARGEANAGRADCVRDHRGVVFAGGVV